MKTYSDTQILEGLAKHHSDIIEYIYQEYLPLIISFVEHNNGSTEQAKDVFQDGMIVVYRKTLYDDLFLRCKFSTYFYAVCKKIWIQERKKRMLQQEKLRQQPLMVEDSGTIESIIDEQQFEKIIQKHLAELSPDCQKILKLAFNDCSMEEIREEMKYSNINYAIDRKYRCKKSLTKKILNDPLFKRIQDETR